MENNKEQFNMDRLLAESSGPDKKDGAIKSKLVQNFSVAPESRREDIERLKNQYVELAQLTKSVREYLLANPNIDKQLVADNFLTEKVRSKLSAEQLQLAEQQIKEFAFDQSQVSKMVEVFSQNPSKALNDHVFTNYIKAGMLSNFGNANAEFYLHNGMMVLKIDRAHFNAISNKVGRMETTPSGFVYDATGDQGATAIMKNVVKQVAIIHADIKPENEKPFLDHEAKHHRNKYTFPEYLLQQYRGKRFRTDIRMLKEEITAGVEEGESFTGLAIRLYGLDIYNYHNKFIKQYRKRLVDAQTRGDDGKVHSQTDLIEKTKIERRTFRKWFLKMFEQASQITQKYADTGNDLLSVTPVRHWKLFTQSTTTINLEAIIGYMDLEDGAADSYGEPQNQSDSYNPYKELGNKLFGSDE